MNTRPAGSARPLTVYSVPMPRVSNTTSSASAPKPMPRPRLESRPSGTSGEEVSLGFVEADLRVERSPEEFLAIAATLGRGYATRSSTPPSGQSVSVAPNQPPEHAPSGHHRSWPAGAKPPSTPRQVAPKSVSPVSAVPMGESPCPSSTTAPRARRFAKPTPKVRGRLRSTQPVIEDLTVDITDDDTSTVRTRAARLESTSAAVPIVEAPASVTREMLTASGHDEAGDDELQRALSSADRPWLHHPITGVPLGPAPIYRDLLTQRLVVSWEEGQAVVFEGRAILPQLGMKLFLNDLLSINDSRDICRAAPSTPPTARQQMVTRARVQEEASSTLRSTADAELQGAGTPPSAFAEDDTVKLFIAKWFYMCAGFGVHSFSTDVDLGWVFASPRFDFPERPNLSSLLPPAERACLAITSNYQCQPSECHLGVTRPPFRSSRLARPADGSCLRSRPPWLASFQFTDRMHTLSISLLDFPAPGFFSCTGGPSPSSCRVVGPRVLFGCSASGSPRVRTLCLSLWYLPIFCKTRRFCCHPWLRQLFCARLAVSRRRPCRFPDPIRFSHVINPGTTSVIHCCRALARYVYDALCCLQVVVGSARRGLPRWPDSYRSSPMPSPWTGHCSHRPRLHTPFFLSQTLKSPLFGTARQAAESSVLPSTVQGSPGPKSGRCSSPGYRPLLSLGLFLLRTQAAGATTTPDARVPLASQVSGEAGSAPPAPRQAPAKPLGTQDATCRSPLPSMQRQKIVKRSLQRVHRRIMRTGGAWYKGKWYNQDTASALTNRLHQQQTPASGTPAPHDRRAHSRAQVQSATTHLPSQSSRHLQVYTWNVGGLGGGLYDEILYYIHRHPVDVLVIQETKWRFTSRWDTHQYFFVHSGSSAADFKQGGLLTIVAKRLVDPGTLRYVDPLPGRLLRVQFYRHSQPCDVLNFYQHTWKATDHIRRLRTQALDHLTRTIHMIPKRSLMIIGGDFNATCVHSAPHVGRYVMERSQLWATDQEDLQALILGLNLCALNTFQSQHPLHTYMWGTQQSQIDYLFVRCDMADGLSRQSYAMHDHPLGAWRGGARHFLVYAQIPTHWRPWSGHASPSVAPAVDRHAIADALSGKADPRIQAFRTDVQSALNPAPASISELHDTVHTLALKHFPKQVPVRGPRPWQDGTLQQYASRMWGHLRSLRKWAARKDAHSSLQALFQCWRHSTLHLRMHRDARQQGRELRKQRRLSLLSDADKAIRQGQSRQFYQLIDKLAPKGRFRKFQMCKGGDLLTPAEELEVMRKHFVQLLNHDRPGDSTLSSTSLAETADTSFQVCSHELQVYLDKLPARKAGAPSTAPGAVWRACSDLISPTLAGLLNQRWDHSPLTPPEPWARATLSLLLKPHKSGSAPKDFRPIGLLDALGKASISMLMSKIRADLEAYIRTSPQFAYLTGRSTSDALRRVYVHNSAARAMRLPSTRDPHYKRAGGKPVTLQGALQVCLDLTSAFDFVPRHLIAEALQDAGITGAPAQLLLSWLHACSYDLYVEGKCAHITTNRGVKQGCPASPLLFAAFMTLITRRLSSRLTPEWVAQYLTMFADDFHVGKCFYGYNELETLSAQIGFVITTLRKHGMSVHATKAQAILTVEGTQRSKVTQKLTRTTEDGRFFRVYTRAGDEFLPLVRKIDYLGAVTTYDSSASATLRRRTLLAKAAHSRLRSVLHAHRSLTVHHRVRLWRATVWPCLAYGLEVCGLTDEHHAQIQTLVMRHLRGIARSPAHITHESDAALAQRLGVPLPRTSLRRCFESAFGRQEPGDNYVLSFEHPWNQFLAQCLADPDPAPPSPGPTAPTPSQLPIVSVPEVAIATAQDTSVDAARGSDDTTGSPVPVAPHSGTEVSSLPAVPSEPTAPVATLPAPVAGSGPFTCPQCQKVCDTRKTLKLHVSRVHKLSLPSHPFDRTLHSLQGMPTCALCLHPFTRWEVLEKHIKSWSCSAMPLPPSFAAQPPPPAQTDPACLPNTAAVPDTATSHAPPCPAPPMSPTLSDVRPDTTVAPASTTTLLSEVPLRSDEEAQTSTGLYDRVLSVWAGGGGSPGSAAT